MLTIVFWTSIAIVAYTFAGYPIALAICAKLHPRPWRRQESEPFISVVMSAYNEAASITRKIENLVGLDYPAGRVEILAGSDGSTDGTAERLLAIRDQRVRVFVFPQRSGKPAVLNTLVARAKGEIIVMSDVRQQFEPGVFRAFARSFADPQVGAVSGQVILTSKAGEGVSEGSGFYWKIETFIRYAECAIDSTIGVTGPIYAIRKSLFEPIPNDTIIDDVLIPVRVIRRGFRVIVDRDARAIDVAYAQPRHEFTRKVRTLAGNFQLFAREPWLLNPFRNRVWWQTVSHKALRLLVAPLQLAILLINVRLLRSSALYEATLIAQIAFYTAAVAGLILPRSWKKPFVITFPLFFCLLSWASVLAFFRSITGRQPVTWQKAAASR